MTHKFSIIIPVRKVNDFVKESISKIKELDYGDYEVLIVLDEKEEGLVDDDKFRYIFTGSLGPAEKRNIAAKESSGDILAFLDDDAYPRHDWLYIAEREFEDESVYALAGSTLTPENCSFLEKMAGKVLDTPFVSGSTLLRFRPLERKVIDDSPTVNLFVRKNVFLSIGGFTVNFWPGEDTKLCLDLVNKFKRGFPYEPDLIVYHHRRELLLPHLKQISRYGRHRGWFARAFPETSRFFPYFIPSLFVLGLFLGPLVCNFVPYLWNIYFSVISVYLTVMFFECVKKASEEKSLLAGCYMSVGMLLTHVVYGFNFIIGYIKKPELKLRKFDVKTGNYIGG